TTREEEYQLPYRGLLLAVDVLLFVLLLVLFGRLFPRASAAEQGERLGAYLLGTLALWPFLDTRLDLVMALLVVASLLAPIGRARSPCSFALLALAVNFKVVPLVLAPVWVIGSLPADRPLSPARLLGALAGRSALLLGMIVALFIPFLLAQG